MRLLKRQPGLPFLLALGVLLILSASFLAVQLWSEDVLRGAVEALEAPMLPPALPVGKKSGGKAALSKRVEPVKPVVAVEVVKAPEVQEAAPEEPAVVVDEVVESAAASDVVEAPTILENAAVVAPAKTKEDVSAAKTASQKASKTDVAAKKAVAEPVKPAVTVVAAKPVIVAIEASPVSSAVKEKPVTASVKKTRGSRVADKEVDEKDVPPEWNWFNTPLKLEFSGGNIEIVPAGRPRDLELGSIVARLPADLVSDSVEPAPSSLEADAYVQVAGPATDKPFVSALARMAKLRYGRKASMQADPVLEQAANAHRSKSLEELRKIVAQLRSRLEAREPAVDADVVTAVDDSAGSHYAAPDLEAVAVAGADMDAGIQSAVEGSDAAVAAADKVDEPKYDFEPYYSGSGSAFSTRINTLLQHGVGYSRK